MELSEKIIRIREENGLTQEQMAERLFVTRQAISKYERGLSCPSLDVLRLLCKEFNVNMDDLLGIGEKEKGEEYKAIGYRHHGFALLYGLLFLFLLGALIAFNALSPSSNAEIWEIAFYDVILGFIALMLAYMLFLSIFPLGGTLVEYNGYGLLVKTLKGKAEIPFSRISAVEIKTHGNWNSGRLLIRTFGANFSVYPLKDLNQVKTIIDEVKSDKRF